MIKADLAEKIRDKLGFQRKDSIDLVESVLEIMKSTLETGEGVKMHGFGVFKVKKNADGNGRNPQNGEGIVLESRKVLTLKASPVLKEYINS